MKIIILLVFALCFILVHRIVRNKIAAVIAKIYLAWWLFCTFASSFNFMGMNEVSGYTYALILLNVVMYIFGYLFANEQYNEKSSGYAQSSIFNEYENKIKHNKLLVICLFVLLGYLLFYYRKYQIALPLVGPTQARNIRFFVGPVFGSTLEVLFFNYIVEAISNVLIIYVAYCFVFGSLLNAVSVLSIIDLLVFTLIGSGRGILAEECVVLFFFCLIQRYLFENGRKKKEIHIRNKIVTVKKKNLVIYGIFSISLMLVVLALITAKRLDVNGFNLEVLVIGGKEFAKQCLVYTTGSLRALDYALHNKSIFGFHFGRMTFAGLDEVTGYLFRGFGFDYHILNSEIGALTGVNISIGSGIWFNALYTSIFRFYFDFGIVGVIVLPFLFGFLVRYSVKIFTTTSFISSLMIMTYLFKASLFSIQNWPFSAPSAVVFIFSVIIIYQIDKFNMRNAENQRRIF